jgi:hydroxyacylglutathione hydrolase
VSVRELVLGPIDTNCFITSDGAGGPAIVIDPAGDANELLSALAGQPVAAIVLTHGHFDHMGAVAELIADTGAPLLVHAADATRVAGGGNGHVFGMPMAGVEPTRLLGDGDRVEAGALALEVLHTPGHTPGSICLLGGGRLFSGDTLFASSAGRTDLPGGDGRALRESIASKLAPLPDEVRVHPGHGPGTTIGRERRVNPFFPRG